MPATDYVQRARVETTVRSLCDEVSQGLSQPWVRAVRAASTSRFADLEDRLDHAVASTDLQVSGVPVWGRAVRVLQWVLLLGAVVGAGWLGVLAGAGYLQLPAPATPDWGGFPVPTVLLVLGVGAGVLLAMLARVLVAVGARSRSRRAERRLREAVTSVCTELVVEPMAGELAAHRATTEGLRAARA